MTLSRKSTNPALELERLKGLQPKKIKTGQDQVYMKPLYPDKAYPVVVGPVDGEVDIHKWLAGNKEKVEAELLRAGALLFRGFALRSVDDFEAFLKSLEMPVLEYKHRSSPRHEVQNNIYTSTDHPSDQVINMHNEHSYSHEWPLKIIFYCLKASARGGETPIADSRKVLARLSEATRRKFGEKDILYVRKLGYGLGMDWKHVFQSDDRGVVERYCEAHNVRYAWEPGDKLKLEFRRPAIRKHPKTGELTWFNHAYFFHFLSLEESMRVTLREEDMPFLTYYGDGTRIEPAVIAEIRDIYAQLKVGYTWQEGDVLVLDNMLMAHGRNSFEGDRKVLVGMLESYEAPELRRG